MIRRTKADQLGKQLLLVGVSIATGIGGKSYADFEPIINEAGKQSLDAIKIFNQYVKFSNTMELLYTKAQEVYKDTLTKLYTISIESSRLSMLIESEKQRRCQPLIMTASQYEAWKKKECKTEADEMEAARAGLYGVAILNGTGKLGINKEGEYIQPDLLENQKRHYGLSHFSKTDHISIRAKIVMVGIIRLMNYNQLIEKMAEALKLPEFKHWQIDLETLLNGINDYNETVILLTKQQMQDELLKFIFTEEQNKQFKELLNSNIKCIDAAKLTAQETEDSRAALAELLEKLPTFDILLARDYFMDYEDEPPLIGAVELLAAEAVQSALDEEGE